MKTNVTQHDQRQLVISVAAEDLRRGDVVAVLNEIDEYPSFLWFCDSTSSPEKLVRITSMACDAGTPMKVKAICLPFVLVKTPCGRHETIDIRRAKLVRLSDDYARRAWKKFRKQKKRR